MWSVYVLYGLKPYTNHTFIGEGILLSPLLNMLTTRDILEVSTIGIESSWVSYLLTHG